MEAYPQARRRVMSDEQVADQGEYTAENFVVLRDANHIRHRPAMYIGDTGEYGLFTLVMEAVTFCLENCEAPPEVRLEFLNEDGIRIHCPRLALPPSLLEGLLSKYGGPKARFGWGRLAERLFCW